MFEPRAVTVGDDGSETCWPTEEEIALVQRLNAATAGRVGNGLEDDDPLEDHVPPGTDPFARLRIPDADELASRMADAGLAFDLAEVDIGAVDDYAVVEVIAAWARLIAWAQAGAARAAAELARRESMVVSAQGDPRPDERPGRRVGGRCAAAHEIAMRLMVSRASAQATIDTGKAITGPLALVGDAFRAGLIDQPRARAFVEGLAHVALPVALAVQEAVLPTASRRTARQVRSDIAAALIGTDVEEATRRHRVARDRRRVCRPSVLPDGMAGIWAVLPAPDAAALDLALDAAARTARSAGDPRSTDALRADVLASVGYTALTTGWIGPRPDETGAGTGYRVGTVGGRPAHIRVTVPLATLLPADDAVPRSGRPDHGSPGIGTPGIGTPGDGAPGSGTAATGTPGDREPGINGAGVGDREHHPPQPIHPEPVAVLDGYGPISPDVARSLALGGTWTRLVTDPASGAVRDVGRTRYHPPAELADFVRTRDGTCTRPGCSAPAQRCDLDHTTPYHLGGHTAHWNLGALCPTDHALKTAGGVRVRQIRPGVFDFDMPSGHAYRRHADGSTTVRRTDRSGSAGRAAARRGTPYSAAPDDSDPPPF